MGCRVKRFMTDGAFMKNQRPITVSKTAQPADEVGIEGQIGLAYTWWIASYPA
jgi:hypothetical protein